MIGILRTLAPTLLALLVVTGCASTRETQPPRTATEQLLVSTAAEHAADKLWLETLEGREIFLSTEHFEGLDEGYAIGAIRELLVRRGAFMVDERSRAGVIVEVRSGALSINKAHNLMLGLPGMSVPVPFAASGLEFPEVPLLKREHQQGVAKFALLAYDARTGGLVGSTGPVYGKAHITRWRVFLVPWTHSNLPALRSGD